MICDVLFIDDSWKFEIIVINGKFIFEVQINSTDTKQTSDLIQTSQSKCSHKFQLYIVYLLTLLTRMVPPA